jgi:hypothetical protein
MSSAAITVSWSTAATTSIGSRSRNGLPRTGGSAGGWRHPNSRSAQSGQVDERLCRLLIERIAALRTPCRGCREHEDRHARGRASSPAPASQELPAGSHVCPARAGRSRAQRTDRDEADVQVDTGAGSRCSANPSAVRSCRFPVLACGFRLGAGARTSGGVRSGDQIRSSRPCSTRTPSVAPHR